MIDSGKAEYAPGNQGQRTWQRSRIHYLWMAYSLFFFIEPVARHNARYWAFCLVIYAVFVALYVAHMQIASPRVQFAVLAAMFLLGVFIYPKNEGSIAFFIYAAAFLPFLLSSSWLIALLLSVDALTIVFERGYFHLSPFNAGIGVFFTLFVGGSNIFFAQKARADCKLRMQQEEIEALAAVAERERIARDLHDVLGHTLSLIVLKAELAGRLLAQQTADAAARAQVEIEDVERTARTALAEVREAIGGYRSRGLAAEIEAARLTLATAGVELDASAAGLQQARLPAAEETVLSLALREAVTNIVRHAHARTCRLRFVVDGTARQLVIEDDGSHGEAREGNGLRGMRERVEALGGSLSVERGEGTRIAIELPAAKQAVIA